MTRLVLGIALFVIGALIYFIGTFRLSGDHYAYVSCSSLAKVKTMPPEDVERWSKYAKGLKNKNLFYWITYIVGLAMTCVGLDFVLFTLLS